MDELELKVEFENVSPEELFFLWLDGEGHSEMTGAGATGEPEVGAAFTAWDGYIEGKTTAIEPVSRILQSWRTSNFPDDAPDSQLELLLESNGDEGTLLTLKHWDIPEGQGKDYLKGWEDHYFDPMRTYFDEDTFE